MRATHLLLFPSLLIGCLTGNGGDDSKDTNTGDGGSNRTQDDFIFTKEAYIGDTTCNGMEQLPPDAAMQTMSTLNGTIQDFQTEDAVKEASVKVWYGDDIAGAPDQTTAADTNGAFTVEVPMCTPLAYGTLTPPEWEETVDTYEVHQVYEYTDAGSFSQTVNSVSEATAKIIPSIIGVEWDRTTGIIAGTAYDCNEDGIGHAQVYLHDADGKAPATGDIYYFDDNNFPANHDTFKDANPENGLWVAINIPSGTWTAEMWGYNGTDYELLGSTVLQIKAGSVNISNIFTGHDDGIAYPDSCYPE